MHRHAQLFDRHSFFLVIIEHINALRAGIRRSEVWREDTPLLFVSRHSAHVYGDTVRLAAVFTADTSLPALCNVLESITRGQLLIGCSSKIHHQVKIWLRPEQLLKTLLRVHGSAIVQRKKRKSSFFETPHDLFAEFGEVCIAFYVEDMHRTDCPVSNAHCPFFSTQGCFFATRACSWARSDSNCAS